MAVSLEKKNKAVREITPIHLMDENEATALYGVKPIPPISQSMVNPRKDDDCKRDTKTHKRAVVAAQDLNNPLTYLIKMEEDTVHEEAIDHIVDRPKNGKNSSVKSNKKKKKKSYVGHYYGGFGCSHSSISAFIFAVFFMVIGSIGVDGICSWVGDIASAMLDRPVELAISDSFVNIFNMLFYALGAIFGAIGAAGTAMSLLRRF